MELTRDFIDKRIKEQEKYIELKTLFNIAYYDPNYKRHKEIVDSAIAQLQYFKQLKKDFKK